LEQTCADFFISTGRKSADTLIVLNVPINGDQSRSMTEQSPKSCFSQKQTASSPETRFFSIVRQCQKPLIAQEKLYPVNE